METDIYTSSDVKLSAYLLTKGARLHHISSADNRHFEFHFSGLQQCEQLKNDFINNSEAPAKELFFQREILITEINRYSRNGDRYEFTGK